MLENNERRLASIKIVSEILPIVGSDFLECVKMVGSAWQCVAKKGEFKVGDKGIYFEIDSLLPDADARFSFLAKGNNPKKNADGTTGYRLKTIKLRGTLSQGLLLPQNMFPEVVEGTNLDELLKIVKYEPPIPASLAGKIKGNFPSNIQKTDEERVQNMPEVISDNGFWEVSEKLDGSSMTVYVYEGNFGVCSRNLDLTETEDNSFWKMARKLNLEEKMKNYGKNIAIQGELVGNGVNGNALKMTDHDLYVFKIWSIDERRYLGTEERMEILEVMELKSVPVVEKEMSLSRFKTVEELLEYAVGKSMVNPNVEREGIVFKKSDGSMSFKAISNKYLLKQE